MRGLQYVLSYQSATWLAPALVAARNAVQQQDSGVLLQVDAYWRPLIAYGKKPQIQRRELHWRQAPPESCQQSAILQLLQWWGFSAMAGQLRAVVIWTL